MGIRRVPPSYVVDVEAARFPFFGREDEGTLVTPTLVLGTTELGARASSPAAASRSEVSASNKAVAFLNDKSDQAAGSVIPNMEHLVYFQISRYNRLEHRFGFPNCEFVYVACIVNSK